MKENKQKEGKKIGVGIVTLIVLMILLVTGCTTADISDLSYNFKQGVTEMHMKQLENAPPKQVYPNSNFKVVVEVDNQGAYPISIAENGLRISGYLDKYFSFERAFDQEDTINYPLEGRSLTNPSGDKILVEFDGKAKQLFENAVEYNGKYFLKAEYSSKVEFVDTICINPNLYSVYDSGCEIQNQKSYSGQGAPIAITKLEEITIPGVASQIEFQVEVRNLGQGRLKKLTLNKATLGGEELVCIFTGSNSESGTGMKEIMFQSSQDIGGREQALIVCDKIVRERSSYPTTLFLDLSYDYVLEQQYNLKIVNPNYNANLNTYS